MANKGWDSTSSGSGWPSTARTTGRNTGTDGASAFIKGSQIADPGDHNDLMDQRDDLYEVPGNLTSP